MISQVLIHSSQCTVFLMSSYIKLEKFSKIKFHWNVRLSIYSLESKKTSDQDLLPDSLLQVNVDSISFIQQRIEKVQRELSKPFQRLFSLHIKSCIYFHCIIFFSFLSERQGELCSLLMHLHGGLWCGSLHWRRHWTHTVQSTKHAVHKCGQGLLLWW